jgi:hypothetical protein
LDFVGFPFPLLLIELSLSDGGCFGIRYHFVHVLDVIELLLRKLDSLLVDELFLLELLPFNIV